MPIEAVLNGFVFLSCDRAAQQPKRPRLKQNNLTFCFIHANVFRQGKERAKIKACVLQPYFSALRRLFKTPAGKKVLNAAFEFIITRKERYGGRNEEGGVQISKADR